MKSLRGESEVVVQDELGNDQVVTVEWEISTEVYGRDADGRRGERRTFCDIIISRARPFVTDDTILKAEEKFLEDWKEFVGDYAEQLKEVTGYQP